MPQGRIPPWVKKFVPILVSALILYYYFHDQDWEKLMDAAGRANLLVAVLAIAIPQLVFWLFEVLIADRHVTWFHGPFDWKKYFWVRGAIYIILLINPTIGGGGIFLYIQRKTEMSWTKLLGIMLFRFGMTLWGIGILMIPATLAMYYYGLAEKAKINMYIWWGILLIPGVWFFIGTWLFWFYNIDYSGIGKIIVRDRNSEFWTAFRVATRKQWFLTWAMGIPPFLFMLVGFYFVSRAFGVNVPFLEFMVVSPLAMAVMDMPIAFGGFGAATLAWLVFFGDYGIKENIAALTLFLPFMRVLIRALIGLVSLRPAISDISTLTLTSKKDSVQSATAPEPENV